MNPLLIIGIILGALSAGPIGYFAGDLFGGTERVATEQLRGQLAETTLALVAKQEDLDAQRQAAQLAAEQAEERTAAVLDAQEVIDAYRTKLASLGTVCRIDADLAERAQRVLSHAPAGRSASRPNPPGP